MPRSRHPRLRWSVAALVLVGVLATSSAAAQSAPSAARDSAGLPFQAGQWGAEFGLGTYTSAGFLRFRSPSRAWVGTVSADYTRRSPEDHVLDLTSALLDLSAGHRWFRAVLPDVSQFITLGGVVGWQRGETAQQASDLLNQGTILVTSTRSSLSVGLVADVGAQWMVTPSLSLGAKWGAQAGVGRDRQTTGAVGSVRSAESTGSSVGFSVGRIAILGTLYF